MKNGKQEIQEKGGINKKKKKKVYFYPQWQQINDTRKESRN